MDDVELVMAYLFEMWTTNQGAKLTAEDVELLMEYLKDVGVIEVTSGYIPADAQ